jgi:hypothetical protein
MSGPEFFAKNKYAVVRGALHKQAAEIAGNSLLIDESFGPDSKSKVDHAQVPGASAFYSNPVMEAILLQMHETVQKNTGLQLCPTYAFARVYRWGDELLRHKDRPSCEVSATLTLSTRAMENWPIWVKTVEGEEKPIELDMGDLMIYRGCEVEHWREPLKEGIWTQVFIHYIDINGPYFPEHAWDKKLEKKPLYSFIKFHMINDWNGHVNKEKPQGVIPPAGSSEAGESKGSE